MATILSSDTSTSEQVRVTAEMVHEVAMAFTVSRIANPTAEEGILIEEAMMEAVNQYLKLLLNDFRFDQQAMVAEMVQRRMTESQHDNGDRSPQQNPA